MKNIISKLPTLLLVVVASLVALLVYQRWIDRPWTRDGQVRADIVKIAPRVSGYIVEIAVQDNQFVKWAGGQILNCESLWDRED